GAHPRLSASIPANDMEERRARRLDRYSMFSVAATRMALKDAGIDLAKEDRDQIGAMMGTALGGIARAENEDRHFSAGASWDEHEHLHFVEGGVRAVDPTLALQVYAGAASCNIAIEFGLCGPN